MSRGRKGEWKREERLREGILRLLRFEETEKKHRHCHWKNGRHEWEQGGREWKRRDERKLWLRKIENNRK